MWQAEYRASALSTDDVGPELKYLFAAYRRARRRSLYNDESYVKKDHKRQWVKGLPPKTPYLAFVSSSDEEDQFLEFLEEQAHAPAFQKVCERLSDVMMAWLWEHGSGPRSDDPKEKFARYIIGPGAS